MNKLQQGLRESPAPFPDTIPLHPEPDPRQVQAVATVLPMQDVFGEIRTGNVRLLRPQRASRVQALRWASARLGFYAYIGFSMLTVVGGFVTAPLMTWLFFNDWRCWRYWGRAWRLFPHSWHIAWQMLKREGQFMFSVPLSSPPHSGPDHSRVELAPSWQHGTSCGNCQRCCEVLSLRCPVLDESTGFCTGYNSFYWRYFNCGRYPSRSVEISYYGCDKWRMK
jgi:hypothetical protein